MAPNETKQLTPTDLVNQLFDAAIVQYGDPHAAARELVVFLTEALLYAISATVGDETARKALLKSVGDSIAAWQPPTPGKQ